MFRFLQGNNIIHFTFLFHSLLKGALSFLFHSMLFSFFDERASFVRKSAVHVTWVSNATALIKIKVPGKCVCVRAFIYACVRTCVRTCVSEWVSERASDRVSEWVSEWMSEGVNGWVIEWVSKRVTERVGECVHECDRTTHLRAWAYVHHVIH